MLESFRYNLILTFENMQSEEVGVCTLQEDHNKIRLGRQLTKDEQQNLTNVAFGTLLAFF